jgi:Ion channel
VRRPLNATRDALRTLFFQRCFYLFITLLAFVSLTPFLEVDDDRLSIRNLINAFVILAAVAAVGRSLSSFLAALLLALPALALRWWAADIQADVPVELSLRCDAALYVLTIALLLRYVFAREVMNTDRLWGAASAYLLIGVLWGYLFTIVDRAWPGSFSVRGELSHLKLIDLVYFSFSTLTTTGFGDIVAVSEKAKMVATLEGIVGQLFIAILIAKLVGVYAPGPAQPVAQTESLPSQRAATGTDSYGITQRA